MMKKMLRDMAKLYTYIVYGTDDYEAYEDYVEAANPQHAVDRVREWHDENPEYSVIQVSKVIKGWK